MVTKIYIEGNLLNLFDDEHMELNSSIANTDDITKINSDYTKTFTVPASSNNNAIFKHFYNADIDNTFDARTKKNASIELDGLPFRTGKIRLEKVAVKNNMPSSYTINFWGDLVNFKDLIKNDELSVLDFSAYNHVYNSANVKTGLITGLFGGDIVYNLISKKRQFLYDETAGNNTNTSELVNIAYNGVARGVVWSELQPSIRLLSIIEAIEAKYGFTFSRDFFDRGEFTNLYMWVNKDRKNDTLLKQSHTIDFDGGDSTWVNLTTDTGQFSVYRSPNDAWNSRKYMHNLTITPDLLSLTTPYTLKVFLNGVLHSQFPDLTGVQLAGIPSLLFFPYGTHTYQIRYEIESFVNFSFSASWQNVQTVSTVFGGGDDVVTTRVTTASLETFTGDLIISSIMPKMKIIDFLKGLFGMFKLVAIPQPDGNVYINNLDDYYREGTIYDITKYIDFEKYDVERGKIHNQIDFKYQDPTTILNKQFKENTGIAYGDELLSLADAEGVPLDGDKLELTLPFEQILFERLIDLEDNTLSNIQYGLVVDEKLEPVNPKPVIFYNNNVQLGTTKLSFINDAGTAEQINTTLNTPAHTLGFNNPTFSTLWGVEFSTWDYIAINGTLFINFWKNYISSIFNIKRRNYKYSAVLPVWLLTKLELNDVLTIKERFYRINDFTVDLLTGDATLNLINTFEVNFGLFLPSQEAIYLNYKAQTYTVNVSNGTIMNIALENIGFGTSWATVTQNESNIVITVTENVLTENRELFINVDNGAGKEFQIYLNQDNKIVTADTTVQTADSTILTSDAE